MSRWTNYMKIDVGKFEKLPELPIAMKVKMPKICLERRKFSGKIVLKNESNGTYPAQENRELIVEYERTTEPAGYEALIEFSSLPHYHISNLPAKGELELNFEGFFKKAGIYDLQIKASEVEKIESRGEPNYDEEHVQLRISTGERICIAHGWKATYKVLRRIKWTRAIGRCYSNLEILLITGSIAAIIAAITSILAIFL